MPALVQRDLRERRASTQQGAERHARDVGVEVEGLLLERQPVAGHAEPFELQAARKIQGRRRALGKLGQRGRVGDGALPVLGDEPREAPEMSDQPVHDQAG
jgi:hypothetical protein